MPTSEMIAGLVTFADSVADEQQLIALRLDTSDGNLYLDRSSPSFHDDRAMLVELERLQVPAFLRFASRGFRRVVRRVAPALRTRVLNVSAGTSAEYLRVRFDESAATHFIAARHADVQLLKTDSRKLFYIGRDATTMEVVCVAEAPQAAVDVYTRPAVDTALPGWDVIEQTAKLTDASLAELFANATSTQCAFPDPIAGCVPYSFPTDGCWARADHIRRVAGPGTVLAKVWIYGDLEADSANARACCVNWDWHCAPVARDSAGRVKVIDPALFPGPVDYEVWRRAIRGVVRAVRFTLSHVYIMPREDDGRSQVRPSETDIDLATYRLKLIDAAAPPNGPPPYNCASRKFEARQTSVRFQVGEIVVDVEARTATSSV